jgi:membrane protein YqaA with SNARE-associated domain
MDYYLNVVFESAWVATVIPMSAEPTFFAMLGFGGFDMTPAFVLAVIGATAGQTFNWGVGRLLHNLKNRGDFSISERWYNRLSEIFRRYLIFLLLLSWVPLCNIFVLVAGFFNLRLRFVLPLLIAGQIFNYGRFLL